MKIKTICIIILIGIIISTGIMIFISTEPELRDDTPISFKETHFVIAIRDNPHLTGIKDVTCEFFDPSCGCDAEYTLQMKFNTYIPRKNQEYTFEGILQNNIYYVEKIKRI